MNIREFDHVVFSPDGVILIPEPGSDKKPETIRARKILLELRIYKDLSELVSELEDRLSGRGR